MYVVLINENTENKCLNIVLFYFKIWINICLVAHVNCGMFLKMKLYKNHKH